MIEIKHRWTGAVLRTVDAENLRGADLRGADLRGADLRGADLRGADLRGANLRYADLRGANLRYADLTDADLTDADLSGADLTDANLTDANLSGANLSGAYLSGAYLSGAYLRGAYLRGANLTGANLTYANLTGANLSGAYLRGANLTYANLSYVAEVLGIVVDAALPARIVAQIEAHPDTWQQDTWHSVCGTRHCIAGFATHLSGALGKYLDKQLGTSAAATLLLWRPGCVMPSFAADATDEETIGRLRVMAAQAEADNVAAVRARRDGVE